MTADLVSMMILYPGKETRRNDAYPRKDYERTKKQCEEFYFMGFYALICTS